MRRRLERGGTMSLDACWELALRWYDGRMEPTWRGRTPGAAGAILAEVGLSGDFWNMV